MLVWKAIHRTRQQAKILLPIASPAIPISKGKGAAMDAAWPGSDSREGIIMKTAISTAIAVSLMSTQCLAGGEPSRSYYPAPEPYYAPPAIVTAPPPPFVGAAIGSLVTGAIGLPFAVLGGIFGAPPIVSCVAPDGSLIPCSAGLPPPPAYGPPGAPPVPGGTRPAARQRAQRAAAMALRRRVLWPGRGLAGRRHPECR
jgi:hypothetical protein